MKKNILNFDSFFGQYSCERQDEFVYHLLAKHLKTPGFFLDVGCAGPCGANNTYVLEKYLQWEGLAFDIGDVEKDEGWHEHRRAKFYQVDATSKAFTTLLRNLVGNRIVDYISLDVDFGTRQHTHLALQRIIDADVKFKIMTLEHEYFKYGDLVTYPTRKILKEKGYQMLFENVCFPDGPGRDGWEDWWIDPKLIPHENIMRIGGKNLIYHECIERVKEL
jgi:hypothetical protein